MASTTTATTTTTAPMKSPEHLKGKISLVKHLLDDAGKRLQDEVSRYTANFKTQPNTMATSNGNVAKQQLGSNAANGGVPNDLIRTISDINTLQLVLSCPIFDRIVNVTDSLDKLSYHLNLHPSIGPADINFDPNGELILAPPIEPMTTNDFINNRLNGLNGHSFANSPQILNATTDTHAQSSSTNGTAGDVAGQMPVNNNKNISNNDVSQHIPARQATTINGSSKHHESSNVAHQINGGKSQIPSDPKRRSNEVGDDGYMTPSPTDRENSYGGTEKLVSTGNSRQYVGNNNGSRVLSTTEGYVDRERPLSQDLQEGTRLYKSNGHFALNEVSLNSANNFDLTGKSVSNGQLSTNYEDNDVSGYSNEMYNTAPLTTGNTMPSMMDYQKIASDDVRDGESYDDEVSKGYIKPVQSQYPIEMTESKSQTAPEPRCHKSSRSPSTSGDSTVRMADECDSGASSYQSQAVRNSQNFKSSTRPDADAKPPSTVYPVQTKPAPLKGIIANEGSIDEHSESMDQELMDKLSPEMERIKVTLEKDSNGLGITIAGYTCEREEISGIFIKSITPGSPAFKSGKIRALDQIFAVNGRELLGYSNPEAVEVLKNTGKKVTLELMRYLAESKYKLLQTALAHAVPSNSTKGGEVEVTPVMARTHDTSSSVPSSNASGQGTNENFDLQDVDNAPNEPETQIITHNLSNKTQAQSFYKNTSEMPMKRPVSHMDRASTDPEVMCPNISRYSQAEIKVTPRPVIGTNKVIETKQGARNTIDIRQPACQTTVASSATYVNKPFDINYSASPTDVGNSNRGITSRTQHDESDYFGSLTRPEWEEKVEIIVLQKDPAQGLGFTVKEYANPKDPKESIIMIRSISPGGVAELDGRLSSGDLLIFVDDISLQGASLDDAVRTLKKVDRHVSLGVLKLKRQ